jgi:CBS domain-containing protein
MMVGGVSQISEMPREPKHEAIMALVGPVVSIALGVLLYGVHLALDATPSFQLRFAAFYLGGLNLFLGFFNLIPAFPMDGGRILRALLARRMGMLRATQISARVGKLFAIVFGVWGLATFNVLLMLIAVFVYAGADSEKRAVLMRELIGDVRVRDLMSPFVATVPAETTVYEAAEIMVRERRMALAVTRANEVIGSATLEAVQSVPPDRRLHTRISEISVPAPTIGPDDTVSTALQQMNNTGVPQLAVTFNGSIIGSIGRDEILRGVQLRELKSTQHEPEAGIPPEQVPPYQVPRGTFRHGNGRPSARR